MPASNIRISCSRGTEYLSEKKAEKPTIKLDCSDEPRAFH
jgi:hypothetical protein